MSRRLAALISLLAFSAPTLASGGDPLLVSPSSAESSLAAYEASALDFRVALTAQRRGKWETAERNYRAAISRDPQFVEAMVNLSRVYLELGDGPAAREWADRVLIVRPRYPAAHAIAGVLSLREGDATRAVIELTRARELSDQDPEVLTNLGAALLREGRLLEAREVLWQVLRIEPTCREATLNLAIAEDLAGEQDHAVFRYRRYIELAPVGEEQVEPVRERIRMIAARGSGRALVRVSSGMDLRPTVDNGRDLRSTQTKEEERQDNDE